MTSPRVAILISGRGSNMTAILDAAERQDWDCTFALVLSNNSDAKGLDRAAERGIPTAVCDHRPYGRKRRREFDAELVRILREHDVDWVVLAGFMRILSPVFVDAFPGRILNIHPSLLPAFGGKGMYGLNVHRAVLSRGCLWTGATVHVVTEAYDEGPILAQRPVPVLPGDTPESLQGRVLQTEYALYPQAVMDLISRYRSR